ncbi:MAG: response regulator [Candidatus Aminicenantes bacterium]|nr:response regulator [Candidatus Aminicenantes bacterium]
MTEQSPKKILVVDDEIIVRKSIRQALMCAAYEIDLATGGEEALKKEAEKRYDVILVDLMMPGMSGIDLLRSLKGQRSRAQIIIMTGYPSTKTSLQSMQLGAFDYLPKPFIPSEIRNLVVRALAAGCAEE